MRDGPTLATVLSQLNEMNRIRQVEIDQSEYHHHAQLEATVRNVPKVAGKASLASEPAIVKEQHVLVWFGQMGSWHGTAIDRLIPWFNNPDWRCNELSLSVTEQDAIASKQRERPQH